MAGILPEVRCDRSTERALQRLMEPAGSGRAVTWQKVKVSLSRRRRSMSHDLIGHGPRYARWLPARVERINRAERDVRISRNWSRHRQATYDAAVPDLREALLQAQYRLKAQAKFPVLILINGIEGAGRARPSSCSTSGWTPADSGRQLRCAQRRRAVAPPAWRFGGCRRGPGATGTRCSRIACMAASRVPS